MKTNTLRDEKSNCFSVSGCCFSFLCYIAVEETFYLRVKQQNLLSILLSFISLIYPPSCLVTGKLCSNLRLSVLIKFKQSDLTCLCEVSVCPLIRFIITYPNRVCVCASGRQNASTQPD
jgi:hypothetical protein